MAAAAAAAAVLENLLLAVLPLDAGIAPVAASPATAVADVGRFPGVWVRSRLYEPRGTLADALEVAEARRLLRGGGTGDDAATATSTAVPSTLVVWLQAADGAFVDVRLPAAALAAPPATGIKSFAGTGQYDSGAGTFTWTREVDYRVAGAPDVGVMRLSSDGDVLVEESALPGDDYAEEWHRIGGGGGDGDTYSMRLACAATGAVGIAVAAGGMWALALGRPAADSGAGPQAALAAAFAPGVDTEVDTATAALLARYLCVVGTVLSAADAVSGHRFTVTASTAPSAVPLASTWTTPATAPAGLAAALAGWAPVVVVG